MLLVKRFTATWCKPCELLAPILEKVENQFPWVDFDIVDVDERPHEVEEFNIKTVPTVLFIKNGEVVRYITGPRPLQFWIDEIKNLA